MSRTIRAKNQESRDRDWATLVALDSEVTLLHSNEWGDPRLIYRSIETDEMHFRIVGVNGMTNVGTLKDSKIVTRL